MSLCGSCKKPVASNDLLQIMGFDLHKHCASVIATQLRGINAHFAKREIEIAQEKRWRGDWEGSDLIN